MTPKQLQQASTKQLILIFKNKARCYYASRNADAVYRELEKRLGSEKTYGIRLEAWHMQHGEGDAMFNEECDRLIDESKGIRKGKGILCCQDQQEGI